MSVARPEDVSSPDAIIRTTYEIISGRANQPRDWDRYKSLVAPGGRIMPIERDANGKMVARSFTVDEFIASRSKILESGDFFEWETAREERRFGDMLHAWSSYDAAREPGGTPIRRGVNSMVLWWDGTRWWELSCAWDAVAAIVP